MTPVDPAMKDVIKKFVAVASTAEQEGWTKPQVALAKAEVLVSGERGELGSLLVAGRYVGTLHLMGDGSVVFEITYGDRAATIVADGKVVEREDQKRPSAAMPTPRALEKSEVSLR